MIDIILLSSYISNTPLVDAIHFPKIIEAVWPVWESIIIVITDNEMIF